MSEITRLVQSIVERAEQRLAPNGTEESYDVGVRDGAVMFARRLCDELGIEYTKAEDE